MPTAPIPSDIAALLRHGSGVFTLRDAMAAGVSPRRVQRLAAAGILTRVATGTYAALTGLRPWPAHAVRARGFLASRSGEAFATGWSAVALRGMPTIGPPPRLPTVWRPAPHARGSSHSAYGNVRSGPLPPEHRARHADWPVVSTAWMVVDLAREAPHPNALVVADAALRAGAGKRAMREVLNLMHRWPGTASAAWVVDHADAGAETALETLGRLAFIEAGLPVPLSNVWVGDGHPVYRLDHLLPYHWVAFEGDGAGKYRNSPDPAAVVAAEKDRHRYLRRRLGLDVERYDWRLAMYQRDRFAAWIRDVLAANPPRDEPIQWWPTDNPFIGPDGPLYDQEWLAYRDSAF